MLEKAAWARAQAHTGEGRRPGSAVLPGLALGWRLPRALPLPCCLHCAHWTVTLSVCLPEQPFRASPLKSRS